MKTQKLLQVLLAIAILALAPLIASAQLGSRPQVAVGEVAIEISGTNLEGHTEVGEIDLTTEIIEYQDGDDLTLRKRAGRTKFNDITLTRPTGTSEELWEWYDDIRQGMNDRRQVSIIVYNVQRDEVIRYNAYQAWPMRWQVGVEGDFSQEVITLAVERIEVEGHSSGGVTQSSTQVEPEVAEQNDPEGSTVPEETSADDESTTTQVSSEQSTATPQTAPVVVRQPFFSRIFRTN